MLQDHHTRVDVVDAIFTRPRLGRWVRTSLDLDHLGDAVGAQPAGGVSQKLGEP